MITVLFLASNPSDGARLYLDQEYRKIERAIRSAKHGGAIDFKSAWAVRQDDLQELLLAHRPTIVHFGGHGNQVGEILLQNEQNQSRPVTALALKQLFTTLKDNVRCVVLNACYSQPQAEAIAEVIDCVIGMSDALSDDAAIEFSTAFYRALAYGKDIRSAFDLGCQTISAEADIPVLVHQPYCDPATICLVATKPLLHPQWQHNSQQALQIIQSIQQRYQSTAEQFTPLFLRPEHTFREEMPAIAVLPASMLWSHRGPIANLPDGPHAPETTGKALPLTEVVDKHPMLVLRGDPGTGKTTACKFLVHRAAQRFLAATDEEQVPLLPLYIELNRFHPLPNEREEDALARLLALALRDYGVFESIYEPTAADGRRLISQAVNQHPLALYFDGLNEVAPAYKGQVEEALKQLKEQLQDSRSRIVITTRRYGFETWRLELSVYDLQPLTALAIQQYLQRKLTWEQDRVEKYFTNTLGTRLQMQASNPLMLNLLAEVLLRHPEEAPQSRAKLFEVFVDGLLERWDGGAKFKDFGQRSFTSSQKRQVLERLGFAMQTAGRVMAVADVLRLFGKTLTLEPPAAQRLLEELCVNHLLQQTGAEVIFTHHTLQEYFCACAIYRSWKQEKTPTAVAWQPSFAEILVNPHWWEALAMTGGLFSLADLKTVVAQLHHVPVLVGMLLGNAAPGTAVEGRFLTQAAEQIKTGIWRTIALTQGMLVVVCLLCAIPALLLFLYRFEVQAASPSILGYTPLNAMPLALYCFFLGSALGIGVYLSARIADLIRNLHDQQLEAAFIRWIEPWLLGMFYVNSKQADNNLKALLASFGLRRFVDEGIRARLRAFTMRALPQDADQLFYQLASPTQWKTAVALLSLDFDLTVARNLLQQLSTQPPTRQLAEIELYLNWLRRHRKAYFNEKGDSFLQNVEDWVRDKGNPYPLRRHMARLLRRTGLTKVRVEWNLRWLVTTLMKIRLVRPDRWVLISCCWIVQSLCIRFGKYKQAEQLTRFAWRLDPNSGWNFSQLIDILISTKQFDEAAILWQQAQQRFPTHDEVVLSGGHLHRMLDNFPEAIRLYRQAHLLLPSSTYRIRLLASALQEAGELTEAESFARKAWNQEPNSGWNLSQLIDILISTKQFDEAAILWQQAQQRFPTNDEVVLSGGYLHYMLDNFPEAIRLYRQAHLLLPSSTRRIRLLASALQEAGELTEAESLARKAWNQEPKEMYSARRLIVILMDKGEYEEAETLIRAALRRHAKAIELLLLKIENLLRVGDYSAVVENCLETVQTRKRIDPLAKESIALLQAEAYLHLCQPVLAIHCLESVENPVGKIELEVLRVLADPEKLCEFTENPIIKRLMLIQKVRQQLSLHNLTIWPDLPQTGLSRWNRQTGLLLQAEYLRPHQPTKAEALVQQAQALSHCNFTRINALLSLAREKHLL